MFLVYALYFLLKIPIENIFILELAPRFWDLRGLFWAISGLIIFTISIFQPLTAGILALIVGSLTVFIINLAEGMKGGVDPYIHYLFCNIS